MRKRPFIRRLAACVTAAAVCFLCIGFPASALFMKEKEATAQSITVAEAESTKTVKFALVFEHTDSYLYRLGNCDSISLGSLFEEAGDTPVDDATVTVTVTPQTTANGAANDDADSSLSATITYDSDTWEDGTIQFTKYTGVVAITISDATSEELTLLAEVVSGYNFESGETISRKSGYNSILLADNTLSSGGTLTIGSGETLFGNGFTLDISGGSITALGIITLNGTIDNTKVTGAVYTEYGDTYGSDYNAASVITYEGAEIRNSYISGSRAAVRMAGDTLIEDSTIEGGYYSNIDIRSGALTLDGDVITINEPVTSGSDTVMGFGIVVNYENANGATIRVDGSLKQYNWVCSSDKSYFASSTFRSAISTLLSSGADYILSYGSVSYVNLGILSLTTAVDGDSVTCEMYGDPYSDSFLGYSGYFWSYDKDTYTITADDLMYRSDVNSAYTEPADAWTPSAQICYEPTWDTSVFEALDSYNAELDALVLSFDEGDSVTLSDISTYLSATKHGQTLSVTVDSVLDADGTDLYNSTADTVSITTDGTHTIVYSIACPLVYDSDAARTDAVTYTVTLSISVTVNIAGIDAPEFTFCDSDGDTFDTEILDISGVSYVSIDTDSLDSAESGTNYGTTTVSGTTITYPVVDAYIAMEGSKLSYDYVRYFPFFAGVSITNYTDEDGSYTTVNASSTFEATQDYDSEVDNYQTDPSTGIVHWASDGISAGAFGGNGIAGFTTYDSVYCLESAAIGTGNSNITSAVTYLFAFVFKAGNGTSYHYYIGFTSPAKDDAEDNRSSCFTAGTLLTLADGSQKAVEDLTGSEKLLVYDHENGCFTSSSILFIANEGWNDYDVITLEFSDGTTKEIIYEHGLFDQTRGEYVFISEETMYDYIGDEFIIGDGETLSTVTLTSSTLQEQYTASYELVTAYQLNYFTNGLLSMAADNDIFCNLFGYDSETLQYDLEQMAADIESYGLFTYEDFSAYTSEAVFEAFQMKYLKISIGKGRTTWEEILMLLEREADNLGSITIDD